MLAAVLAAAAAVGILWHTSTPGTAILRYSGYLLFAVVLPGTLAHRALRGRHPLLIADLALGAATGLALELLAWAVFTAVHQQRCLWVWPLLVAGPLLATRSVRRRILGSEVNAEYRPGTSWAVAAAFVFAAGTVGWTSMLAAPLPPRPNAYYLDLYWQLSVAAELTRQLPPEVPQVAGRTLYYHWFANAHLAASSLISGVELPVVLLRLWLLPVVAIVLGLLVAVARRVSDLAWAGAVAAALLAAPAAVWPWPWYRPASSLAITPLSPSQLFGLIFLLLAASVLVDLVRGRRLGRGGWAVLILAVVAASGSKSAVLPVLLGALLCALLANVVRRESIRPTVGAVLLVGVVLVASSRVVAGGSAGGTVRFLGILAFLPPWRRYAPTDALGGTGGLVVPGLTSDTVGVAALLTGTLLLQYVYALAGLALLGRRTRADPAIWLLVGGLLAGTAAALVLDHVGAGQLYFSLTAAPLGAVLAGWGFAVALQSAAEQSRPASAAELNRPASRWRTGWLVVLGAGAGGGAFWLAYERATTPDTVAELPSALGGPLVVLGVAAAVGFAGWFLLARRRRWRRAGGPAVFGAAVLAGSLLSGPQVLVGSTRSALDAPPTTTGPLALLAGETEAARWLSRYAEKEDIVATNVHCRSFRTTPNCDARAFWVSGLSERRVLVEGWGYTDEAQAAHGRDGLSYRSQPFDDPALLRRNDLAFTAPTAAGLEVLRDAYGVRWLFAARRAGPVSPLLARYARLRLANPDVVVYELTPP